MKNFLTGKAGTACLQFWYSKNSPDQISPLAKSVMQQKSGMKVETELRNSLLHSMVVAFGAL